MVAQARLTAVKNGNLDAQVKNAAVAGDRRARAAEERPGELDQLSRPNRRRPAAGQAAVDQATQQLRWPPGPAPTRTSAPSARRSSRPGCSSTRRATPYTDYDLQQQQQAVAQAEAQLRRSQNPYTEQDLAAAQAAVDQARAQLDLAAARRARRRPSSRPSTA